MIVGMIFYVIALVMMFLIEHGGPFSPYPTLACVFMAIGMFFYLVATTCSTIYCVLVPRACGRWIRANNIDGIAVLLDDVRQDEIPMSIFSKYTLGKNTVYLLEMPSRWKEYIAGWIVNEVSGLFLLGFCFAWMINEMFGVYDSVWATVTELTPCGIAMIVLLGLWVVTTITAAILRRRGGGDKRGWLEKIWSDRTGFALPNNRRR